MLTRLAKTGRTVVVVMALLSVLATILLVWRTDRSPRTPVQTTPTNFYKARVVEILEEGTRPTGASDEAYQKIRALILSKGDYKDKTVELEVSGFSDTRPYLKTRVGEKLVLMRAQNAQSFFVANKLRLSGLYVLAGLFALVVLIFAGRKGLFSIVGLGVTIAVLTLYSVPSLLSGSSPLGVTLLSATIILSLALPLAHGFNLRTAISLISSLAALLLAGLMAILAVKGLRLFGTGSEEGVYLQFLGDLTVDTRGILLGGIIIGTLGVIDDIVASQVATVAELKSANPALAWRELFTRGLRVGREHIASLVNTLVLAYTGASLPLLLLFSYYQSQPLWTILNSDVVSEEIARTLIGSMTLVIAVPVATLLAALTLAESAQYGPS
ncbi:MAG: YibE/F family protein [Candidatus Andersenbacteria bacterium]